MFTVAQQVDNVLTYIERLSTCAVKQQNVYMGNKNAGYNFIGYACEVFDIDYDIKEKYSEELVDYLGIYDKYWSLQGRLPNYPAYKSLYLLSQQLNNFKNLATLLKSPTVIRCVFKPYVAVLLIEKLKNG